MTKHCYKGMQRATLPVAPPPTLGQSAGQLYSDEAVLQRVSSVFQQPTTRDGDWQRVLQQEYAYRMPPPSHYRPAVPSPNPKRRRTEPGPPRYRAYGEEDEDSDYEQLEMVEHTSEGVSSDWDGESEGVGYLELVRGGRDREARGESPLEGDCCSMVMASPHLNVPPYISLLNHPGQAEPYRTDLAMCDVHHFTHSGTYAPDLLGGSVHGARDSGVATACANKHGFPCEQRWVCEDVDR